MIKREQTIEEPLAVEMTEKWRAYYSSIAKLAPDQDDLIFRGFHIPIDDLRNLVALADEHENIIGVRGYLAVDKDADIGSVDPDKMHILLVPTAGTTLENAEDKLSLGGSTSIQNFTKPCPAQCDLTSALHTRPVGAMKAGS